MTAGYSGTPLARKLGIREGHRVLLVGAPTGLAEDLSPLPPDVRLHAEDAHDRSADGDRGEAESRFDVVLFFCPEADALREGFAPTVGRIRWDGGLWACWPKKSSPLYVDLVREEVREVGLSTGLVDNKVCAVNEDWSGLRFVVRSEDRPASGHEGGPGR